SRLGGEVVPYKIGGRRAHLINHPAHAEHVLERNEGNYENPRHPYAELGMYYTDGGRVLLGLERRGMDRSCARQRLAEIMAEQAVSAAERLIGQSEQGAVDV